MLVILLQLLQQWQQQWVVVMHQRPWSFGSATAIPVLTVDNHGRITPSRYCGSRTGFTIAADSGSSDTVSGGETLTFEGDTGITTTASQQQNIN